MEKKALTRAEVFEIAKTNLLEEEIAGFAVFTFGKNGTKSAYFCTDDQIFRLEKLIGRVADERVP